MVKKLAVIAAVILVIALVGAALVLLKFDLPHDEMVRKYANDASQFMTLPDGSVAHYRDQGNPNGEAVLLVHGSNASLHTWEPWVRRLGDTYRLISVDLPGHGLTGQTPGDDYSRDAMVEFVRDVMTALEIERFAIAGNSMGGGVALGFAADYPMRTRALILISSGGLPPDPDRDLPLGLWLANDPVGRQIMRYVTPRSLFAGGLRDAIADDRLVTDDMIDRYYELNLHEGNRAATILRFQGYDGAPSLIDRLDEIDAPTLILWGEEDPVIPVTAAHKFKELMPHAKLVIYDNVAHVAMEEVPDQSAADARVFLSGL